MHSSQARNAASPPQCDSIGKSEVTMLFLWGSCGCIVVSRFFALPSAFLAHKIWLCCALFSKISAAHAQSHTPTHQVHNNKKKQKHEQKKKKEQNTHIFCTIHAPHARASRAARALRARAVIDTSAFQSPPRCDSRAPRRASQSRAGGCARS